MHIWLHINTHSVKRTILYISAQRVCDLREMIVVRVSTELTP